MDQSLMAPFVPRPRLRRALVLVLPALLVALAVGCGGHRRSSMRPVYVSPANPCPSGNCGGAVVPSSPSTTTTVEPSLIEPGPAREAAPMNSTPSASNSNTPPPVTGPALPGAMEEPDLERAGTDSSKAPATPGPGAGSSGNNPSGGSATPGTSLKSSSGGGGVSPPARVRQASLGARLKPFVDVPEDLFSPPKADKPWKYIVLHHSANATGSYNSIDREHRERLGWQGCGYHFVIGNGSESPDGKIEVSQRWVNQKHGVHCRDGKNPDVNEYGIGICLVGDLEKTPPTPRQVAAARALVAYLSTRYGIQPDHTETHAHLAASPTSCPGRLFPSQAILGGAKGLALR
jgi:hypothetical protein